MATSEQVDAILRDDYKEYWEQLNNAAWLLAQIETKRDTVDGRTGPPRRSTPAAPVLSVVAVKASPCPPPASQRHNTVPIPVRWNTARIQLTVQLMKMATGNPGAFVNALEIRDGRHQEETRCATSTASCSALRTV
jgi:hypothetical protein